VRRGNILYIQDFGDLRERDHLEDRRRWQDNIKMDIKK
jgi:hypothetical protein